MSDADTSPSILLERIKAGISWVTVLGVILSVITLLLDRWNIWADLAPTLHRQQTAIALACIATTFATFGLGMHFDRRPDEQRPQRRLEYALIGLLVGPAGLLFSYHKVTQAPQVISSSVSSGGVVEPEPDERAATQLPTSCAGKLVDFSESPEEIVTVISGVDDSAMTVIKKADALSPIAIKRARVITTLKARSEVAQRIVRLLVDCRASAMQFGARLLTSAVQSSESRIDRLNSGTYRLVLADTVIEASIGSNGQFLRNLTARVGAKVLVAIHSRDELGVHNGYVETAGLVLLLKGRETVTEEAK